ncbi:hypothetical protein G6O67_001913 [Ophiocordyceps sinensis]|uniref:Uncharacterized protein n=1 Tax=Ophiocordyceps sinensis TaxID=72228 RepID=A0A8H4PTD3_9HYPO|nr:hypothetical protein G6O67_001913 [Ophiocordyceps sinensis]
MREQGNLGLVDLRRSEDRDELMGHRAAHTVYIAVRATIEAILMKPERETAQILIRSDIHKGKVGGPDLTISYQTPETEKIGRYDTIHGYVVDEEITDVLLAWRDEREYLSRFLTPTPPSPTRAPPKTPSRKPPVCSDEKRTTPCAPCVGRMARGEAEAC